LGIVQQTKPTAHSLLKPVAICVAGQARGFRIPFVFRTSYETLVGPVREEADVFFALDATSAGIRTSVQIPFDEYPNHTNSLPTELLELFAPVAIEWGHAERRCCVAWCEGASCTSRAALLRTPPDQRCADRARTSFGQRFSIWRAWQLVVAHEQNARQGREYEWVMRFRPDNMFNRPLPPYATWPSARRWPRLLYTEGGEALVLSSRRCCGKECIGGADHLMLATRAAARAYMEGVFERYFTWPKCNVVRDVHEPGCDAHGPAGALPRESISPVLSGHGVSMCKSGLSRAMVRETSLSAQQEGLQWLESPVNHRPALLLRPPASNRSGALKGAAARCPQAKSVCSYGIDESNRAGM
jgi:hypothetical protein